MSEVQTARIVLAPWNGHTAYFTVIVDGKTIYNKSTNHGEWNVAGDVELHWTGHTYKFNTKDCVSGEKLNIGYVKVDQTKVDSITVTCEESNVTTTTVAVPATTSPATTAVPTTVPAVVSPVTAFVSVSTPLNGNLPCTTNCGLASAVEVSTESLPITGSNSGVEVGIALTLGVIGVAFLTWARRLRHG